MVVLYQDVREQRYIKSYKLNTNGKNLTPAPPFTSPITMKKQINQIIEGGGGVLLADDTSRFILECGNGVLCVGEKGVLWADEKKSCGGRSIDTTELFAAYEGNENVSVTW